MKAMANLLTRQEVADRLKVGPQAVSYLVTAGQLPVAERQKGRPYFRRRDVRSLELARARIRKELAEEQTPLRLRAAQAIELREQGLNFSEIARRLGYAHASVARRAMLRAIARRNGSG